MIIIKCFLYVFCIPIALRDPGSDEKCRFSMGVIVHQVDVKLNIWFGITSIKDFLDPFSKMKISVVKAV